VKCEADADAAFEEQLQKLQTDYIDFYMVHALNAARWETVKSCNVIQNLRKKREEGKIKFIGFSFHGDSETFNDIIDYGGWDFAQIQINYADYNMIRAKDLYDKLLQADVPCICMEPVRGGFLANPPQSVASLMSGFGNGDITPAGWAFRWCIDKEMPVILSGMSSEAQVAENIETFSTAGELTSEQRTMIETSAGILSGIKSIPCTACGYCMDCPLGVDIPRVFEIYNHYQLFRNDFRSNVDYQDLAGLGRDADKCTRCGACSPMCPQGIEVPDVLADAKGLLSGLMK
jgi:predicted aldo/keto reductase-like oxidoreductase